jgi:GNAT superfamily N-acetyltransferase
MLAPGAYGSTYRETLTWPDERWRSLCRLGNYYLAQRDGAVVGMVSGGTNDQYPGTKWLYGLYVAESDRGTGVAIQLVAAVEDWARRAGASSLHLHVNDRAERAKAFYEKVGFAASGGFVTMLRDRSIRLIEMVKNIE